MTIQSVQACGCQDTFYKRPEGWIVSEEAKHKAFKYFQYTGLNYKTCRLYGGGKSCIKYLNVE